MDRFYTNLMDKLEEFFQSSDDPKNVASEEEAELIGKNCSSESECEPLRTSQVDGYWTNFIDPKCFREFQSYGLENSDLETFGDLSLNDDVRRKRINYRKVEYLSDKLPTISLNEDAMVDDASESGDSMAANPACSGSRSALSSVVDADANDLGTLSLLEENKDRDAPSSPKSCPPDASDKQCLGSTEELDSRSGEASGSRVSRSTSKLCSHSLVLEECERCSEPTPHFLSPETARKVKSPVKPRSHSAITLSPRKMEPIAVETRKTRLRSKANPDEPSMPKKRLSQDDDDNNVGVHIEQEMASKKRRASRDETGDSSKN